MKKLYDVAIAGNGLVAKSILKYMAKLSFPVGKLFVFGPEQSLDKMVEFSGKEYKILALSGENVIKNRVDITFLCANSEVSKRYAPLFNALGSMVIDCSPAFRQDDAIPLVVSSVNPDDIYAGNGIVSIPSSAATASALALFRLNKRFGIKRIVYTTYQSASCFGEKAVESFKNGLGFLTNPFCGELLDTGYTTFEHGLIEETKKILCARDMSATATAVNVPQDFGVGISINLQLGYSVSLLEVERELVDDGGKALLLTNSTFSDALKGDKVLLQRLRRDPSFPNSFSLWLECNNILLCAKNAVEVALLMHP